MQIETKFITDTLLTEFIYDKRLFIQLFHDFLITLMENERE